MEIAISNSSHEEKQPSSGNLQTLPVPQLQWLSQPYQSIVPSLFQSALPTLLPTGPSRSLQKHECDYRR